MNRYFRALAVSLLIFASLQAELHAGIIEKHIDFSVSHPLHQVKGAADQIEVRSFHTTDGRTFQGPFQIEIPVTGLNTGNGNRDSHMLEILHYPKYKSVLVEVQEMQPLDAGHATFRGFLTIAGVRRFVAIPASLSFSDGMTTVDGTTSISMKEFQIEAPSLLGISVSDAIVVHFRFVVKDSD